EAGRRYRCNVDQAGLKGEIWLSMFDLRDFVLIGGELQSAEGKAVVVNGIQPCTIEIELEALAESRFFSNSGTQNYSGSLPITSPRACRTKSTDPNHPPYG